MEKKRIKILYLIPGLKTGGAEMVLYELVKNLGKDRFESVIVSIIPIAEIGEKIKKLGVPVLSLNAKFKFNPLIFFRFLSILRKEKPQILHSFLFHAIFLGRIARKVCKVPIIISSIHSEYIGGFLRNRILEFTSRLDNVVIIVSQKAKEKMVEAKAISARKTIVIYNGIDINRFKFQDKEKREKVRKALNLKESDKVLISVGRLFRAKGYPYLIEAIKILKKQYPDIVLLVLGKGRKRIELEKQIRGYNLTQNIFLLGRKENVPYYLNASDIFVMSSLWEGLPLSLLEAMVCGLPVVATNVGGIPEIVDEGHSGFLVESKNSLALAKKISYVLNSSPEIRRKMGEVGRKIVEEKFSLDKMVKNYESLYEKLLRSYYN
jgi:glycosyltransferase involved in cell wall biosynthesis